MTALKMHWQLTQGADGRPHLNMQWESARSQSSCAALHARKFTEVQDENEDTR